MDIIAQLSNTFAEFANAQAIGHNAHTEAFEHTFFNVAIKVEKAATEKAGSFEEAKRILTNTCKSHGFPRNACYIEWNSSEGYKVWLNK